MMRYLLFFALLFSFSVNAQVGKRPLLYIGGGSPPPEPPSSGFNWANLTSQAPTAYNNCGTVLIENKSFTNLNSGVLGGDNVQVGGSCNITFRNCYFGPSIRNGASVENLTGTARFVNCLFASNKVGIEFSSSSGNVQVDSSQCINPWGAPKCKGQFVQFAGAGGPNSYIRNCAMENFRGEGATEDWISMFGAVGTPSSYIQISNNLARGGGPSNSGGGFIAGDGNGSYIVIENNKLYNPGNYIVAAAGGDNIIIRNNQGYQADNEVQNIATYAYITDASDHCNDITMTGNSMLLQNSNNYYCYCTPTCGDVIGVDESQGDPTNGWLQTNSRSLTLAQLAFPTTIITFVDADRLWHIRDDSQLFSGEWNNGPCYDGVEDSQYPRPVSNAGANQSITVPIATLNGSGSTSTDGFNYRWVQVSGPNTAIMSAPLAVSNGLSGLVTGTYEFRLEVTNNSGAADADWMTVTVNTNLVYIENFEGSQAFATYVSKQIETTYGLTLATSPVFEGSKSGRFELRDTDPMNNNGTRAEVSFPTQTNLERWYGFAVYFPSADYVYDDEDEIINQWHQGGGVTPSLVLGTKIDRYRLQVKETTTTTQNIDLGVIAKNTWNTFVFHIKHSSGVDGLIELWLNGVQVVNRTGINMYDTTSGQFYSPKWKLGVYKSAWNGSNTTLTNKRVLYYDDVRIGNENATLADMGL